MSPTLDATQYRTQDKSDTKNRRQVKYTGPASYVTGGDPLVPADVGLGQIHVVSGLAPAWNGSAVRLLVYDKTTQKVLWYVPNTGAEVANGTDLSAYSVDAEFIGL